MFACCWTSIHCCIVTLRVLAIVVRNRRKVMELTRQSQKWRTDALTLTAFDAYYSKSVQSNLGTGRVASGPWAVQHCAVACIHEYASCPSAAKAAVIAARAANLLLACEFW